MVGEGLNSVGYRKFFLHYWHPMPFFTKDILKGRMVENDKGTKYFKTKLSGMVETSLHILYPHIFVYTGKCVDMLTVLVNETGFL